MTKNKFFLMTVLTLSMQPLWPTESKSNGIDTKNNGPGWLRSPFVWGAVALGSAVGAWVYKKYLDYKKLQNSSINVPLLIKPSTNTTTKKQRRQKIHKATYKKRTTTKDDAILISQKTTPNNDPYTFIYSKYAYYLNNVLKNDGKNFFEKVEKSQNNTIAQSVLTQKLAPIVFSDKYYEILEKNEDHQNNCTLILKNIIQIIDEAKLDAEIKKITTAKTVETKEKLLKAYAMLFSETQKKINEVLEKEKKINNEAATDTEFFCNLLLKYYEPIDTLKAIKKTDHL